MATLKDIKEGYKQKLRDSFESNTGVLGQAMQDRREKEAKDQQIQRRVDKVNQTTEAIRLSGSTLTHIEVLFTQISKNFQLVNKEFGVAVTLQEETNKTLAAVAAARLEKKQDVTATQLTFGAMPKGEELEDIKFDDGGDAGGPSILESILDALDFGLDRAKKAAKKAAARRAARKAAQRAAKKAAKDAAKKAAQKAGAKAAKEAAKKGLEGKAKQQFIKQAEKAAAKAAEEKAAKQMAQIAEKQAARAAKKEALEAAEKAAAKAAEKKAAEVAEKKAAEAAAKKAAEVAAKAAAEAATKKATKEVIKKSAIKAVAKNLAKAGVKSIPLVGAAVGVGFAVVKIFQGDYVGAGVEAASGVGSAVTAVPAAVYSTIREVYFEVYGVWPESDPKVNERMPELKQIVTDEASNFLGKKVEPGPPTPVKAPPPTAVPPPPTAAPPPHVCTCPPVTAVPAVGAAPVVQTPVAAPPQEKGRSGYQGMAPQPTPAAAPAPTPTAAPASTPGKAAPTPTAPPPTPVAGAAVAATGPAPKPKTGTSVDGEALVLETLKRYNYPPPAIAMIMAQAAHESGHFKHLEENMSYSAKALMKTWPSRFPTTEIAEAYANKPEKIANKVYGGRAKDLGNGPEESGDGWKYRGRGYIGITGRSLYEKAGKALGIDLINNPDMAADPKTAAELVVYFFKSQAKRISDWMDIEGVTRVVNGGIIGLEDRKKQFKTYLAQLEAGTLLSGGSKASSGAAVAEQSTQVAAVKADNKQQQPNVNIIKINETNRKTVTV